MEDSHIPTWRLRLLVEQLVNTAERFLLLTTGACVHPCPPNCMSDMAMKDPAFSDASKVAQASGLQLLSQLVMNALIDKHRRLSSDLQRLSAGTTIDTQKTKLQNECATLVTAILQRVNQLELDGSLPLKQARENLQKLEGQRSEVISQHEAKEGSASPESIEKLRSELNHLNSEIDKARLLSCLSCSAVLRKILLRSLQNSKSLDNGGDGIH